MTREELILLQEEVAAAIDNSKWGLELRQSEEITGRVGRYSPEQPEKKFTEGGIAVDYTPTYSPTYTPIPTNTISPPPQISIPRPPKGSAIYAMSIGNYNSVKVPFYGGAGTWFILTFDIIGKLFKKGDILRARKAKGSVVIIEDLSASYENFATFKVRIFDKPNSGFHVEKRFLEPGVIWDKIGCIYDESLILEPSKCIIYTNEKPVKVISSKGPKDGRTYGKKPSLYRQIYEKLLALKRDPGNFALRHYLLKKVWVLEDRGKEYDKPYIRKIIRALNGDPEQKKKRYRRWGSQVMEL